MIKRIMIPRVIMDIDRHGFKRRHLTRKRVEERIILSTHSLVSTPNIPTIKKAGWGEVKRGPTAPVRRLHSLCQYTESVRLLGCLASLAFDLSIGEIVQMLYDREIFDVLVWRNCKDEGNYFHGDDADWGDHVMLSGDTRVQRLPNGFALPE